MKRATEKDHKAKPHKKRRSQSNDDEAPNEMSPKTIGLVPIFSQEDLRTVGDQGNDTNNDNKLVPYDVSTSDESSSAGISDTDNEVCIRVRSQSSSPDTPLWDRIVTAKDGDGDDKDDKDERDLPGPEPEPPPRPVSNDRYTSGVKSPSIQWRERAASSPPRPDAPDARFTTPTTRRESYDDWRMGRSEPVPNRNDERYRDHSSSTSFYTPPRSFPDVPPCGKVSRWNAATNDEPDATGALISPSFPRNFQRNFGTCATVPRYDIGVFKDVEDDLEYVDTHCHLDFLFKRLNYQGTYGRFVTENGDCYPKQYAGCVAVFCDPTTFKQKDMWEPLVEEENVWAAFGCHPHLAYQYDSDAEKELKSALGHHKVVALGEIGLDYSFKNRCEHDVQKEVFRRQLRMAVKRSLPLVIHSRDASEDTMAIMKELVPKNYYIHRHCFTEDWTEAQRWLKEFPNLFLGITALVTFPSAKKVHEVARMLPLDRLLLETDSPYFLPRNEPTWRRWSNPGMAAHVAAQIASFRSDSIANILRATRENTRKMYGI